MITAATRSALRSSQGARASSTPFVHSVRDEQQDHGDDQRQHGGDEKNSHSSA